MPAFTKLLIPTFLLIALTSGCGGGDKPPAGPGGPGAAMPPPEVDTITVAGGKATFTQDLPGRLQEEGMAVIVVEQHARLALELTERAIVLDRGRIVHQSSSRSLLDDPATLDRLVSVA